MYKYIPVLYKDRICLLYSNDNMNYFLLNNLPDYDGSKPKYKLLIQNHFIYSWPIYKSNVDYAFNNGAFKHYLGPLNITLGEI